MNSELHGQDGQGRYVMRSLLVYAAAGATVFLLITQLDKSANTGFLILILLACPLMHLLMHGRHAGH